MERTIGWYPIGTRNPFIRELITHDEGRTLVYDGYFYVDAADLPVQRIMVTYGEPVRNEEGSLCYTATGAAHVEIYEKISGEDTSFRGCDADVTDNTADNAVVQDLAAAAAAADDEDDYDICFFPTEITTLKYRVLKSNLTPQESSMIEAVIKEQTKEMERNRIATMLAAVTDDGACDT